MTRWDECVRWHLELVSPPATEPVSLEFVRDEFLRTANDDAEDAYIKHLITVTRRAGERTTRRAFIDQRWELVMDRFPSRQIELPRPPGIEVVEITYLDDAGDEQTWSPSEYRISRPIGPTAGKTVIRPVYNGFWPQHRVDLDSVRVTYRAGYVKNTSPTDPDVPEDIIEGMLRMIGELYKRRSESMEMIGGQVTPAIIRALDFWLPYRVELY